LSIKMACSKNVTFKKWRISVAFSATLFYQLFCWQMLIIVIFYFIKTINNIMKYYLYIYYYLDYYNPFFSAPRKNMSSVKHLILCGRHLRSYTYTYSLLGQLNRFIFSIENKSIKLRCITKKWLVSEKKFFAYDFMQNFNESPCFSLPIYLQNFSPNIHARIVKKIYWEYAYIAWN
jgi:hypothetical protein